jgi:NRAMP (natural resistance-associated macrophage protein)-like metal ion transporter
MPKKHDKRASCPKQADGSSVVLGQVLDGERNPAKRLLRILGPGLITGASDDDPSGIGTYAVAGASLGYSILWTALITFPMMTAVQFICAKIGMVSGMGLARVIRKNYSGALLYPVLIGLVIANTINAGADIGAIAAAVNLLLPVPIAAMTIPIGLIILALQLWGSYAVITKIFKWLTVVLFAYIISAVYAKPDMIAVFHGTFVPRIKFDSAFLTQFVAILGTTISPYLFFWQSSHEVAEQISIGRRTLKSRQGATGKELQYARLDVTVGMLLSNSVMYFIILCSAATLFKNGKTGIQSASEAAQALGPLAGNFAYILFAIGLIGAGFLAVPILTGSSAYATAEVFGWQHGLDENPRCAKLFYSVIATSTLIGVGINFLHINPISALFWTAVINGFVAPPMLFVIMRISNNPEIMGQRVNGFWTNAAGWLTTIIMSCAAAGLVVTWSKSS